MIVLAGGEQRAVDQAAAPVAPEKHARAVDDRRARRGAAREVGVGNRASSTNQRSRGSATAGCELVGAREDPVALDDRDVHAVRAAGVGAERAARDSVRSSGA